MTTLKNQTKYVEWLSVSNMHQETLNWNSELNFIKVEQIFFQDLIKSYTIQLIGSEHFDKSKQIVDILYEIQKETNLLFEIVKRHRVSLQILVDGVNQIKEEKAYKKEHKDLIVKLSEFIDRYNNFKETLFKHIKNIIKENKQKRLLD